MPRPSSIPLSTSLQATYGAFVSAVTNVPPSLIEQPIIEGTGGMVSVRDILAYQIGWGTQLIEWYTKGVAGEIPHMPAKGFATWDYVAIARHFYTRHRYATLMEQLQKFQEIVSAIVSITEKELANGRLGSVEFS